MKRLYYVLFRHVEVLVIQIAFLVLPWTLISTGDAKLNPKPAVCYKLGDSGIAAPQIMQHVAPYYPRRAYALRLEGSVLLQAIFKANGSIDQIQVIKPLHGGHYGFENAAAEAIRLWRFIPGKRQGTSVDVQMLVSVQFAL
ncbi:MAG: energy transducer TonB [Acidobacteria bacterium]|nr:energy transducer TonB [Acidobacteriota bacterium]